MIRRRGEAAIAWLLLSLALAACDAGSPAGPVPAPAPVEQLPRGGSVVAGVFGEPATLDPYSPLASDLTYALATPVYRSLYRFDEQGAAVPDLVAELEPSGDVATLTLGEAKWSDGSAITSADVAATIARAAPPSGLSEIDSVLRRGPRRLVVTGDVEDWPETLARISYVLPRSSRELFSGPFKIASRTEGLEVVLRPNPAASAQPLLDKVTVRFTEGTDFLVALLQEGELDVAALPSSINLDQRLDELELAHGDALGWEQILIDLGGSDLSRTQREEVAEAVDKQAIEGGFVRGDGRATDTLAASPEDSGGRGPFTEIFRGKGEGAGATLQLAAPNGDDLIELIQRVVQVQLDSTGFDVELVNVDARTFYGEWGRDDVVDAAIRRVAGAPGAAADGAALRSLDALPLFQVETVMAWREGVGGIGVVPTLQGPLSKAHEWHVAPGGG